ncbi:hypothetical protein D9756_002770 [Leucocoprinus leucothites]|uniref:Uncharacterized protein n=1 Tax=Leucocoprinus leucothites TaxID=201217 RepID=A0A8H5GCM5_9AGAR|nr:hypothetical protein D9756_002770 [Leucoagaricus leucothites]
MDDSSHNSTLSNRIAAPNPLDLTLEHLDIVTENESKAGVEDVKVCGAKWHKPDPVHTPKAKTRVSPDGRQIVVGELIYVVKGRVVDELSKLPPVRLILPEQAALIKSEKEAVREASADVAATATIHETHSCHLRELSTCFGPSCFRSILSPLSLTTRPNSPQRPLPLSKQRHQHPLHLQALLFPSPTPTLDITSSTTVT